MTPAIIVCGGCGDAFWADRRHACAAIAMEAAKPTRRETGSARKGDSAGPKDIAQPIPSVINTGESE